MRLAGTPVGVHHEGPAWVRLGRGEKMAVVWTLLVVIWGSTWLVIKVGLGDLPPFLFAGIRFTIALVPLLFLLSARGLKWPRRREDWVLLGGTAFLSFTLGYGLVFWAEQYIPSGLTAVLFTTYPLFGQLWAHAILPAERLTAKKAAGALLGLGGVLLIFAGRLGLEGPLAVWGGLAVVGSAASGSLGSVLIKARGGHLDPGVVTAAQMSLGGLPLLLIGLAVEGNPARLHWTPTAVLCLLYLALVGSSLAFVLWYRLLKTTEVTRAQVIPLLNTVVAVILGWLVLGETFGVRGAVGTLAVLAGTALVLRRPATHPR